MTFLLFLIRKVKHGHYNQREKTIGTPLTTCELRHEGLDAVLLSVGTVHIAHSGGFIRQIVKSIYVR